MDKCRVCSITPPSDVAMRQQQGEATTRPPVSNGKLVSRQSARFLTGKKELVVIDHLRFQRQRRMSLEGGLEFVFKLKRHALHRLLS